MKGYLPGLLIRTVTSFIMCQSSTESGECTTRRINNETFMSEQSLISHLLFEKATDISFCVGIAINPAYRNPNLPINFNIKMSLVQELSEVLRKMGKRIRDSYF